MESKKWFVYIIKNKNSTYVDFSDDLHRTLLQHNKKIQGGSEFTTLKVTDKFKWEYICHIEGFKESADALRFIIGLKHIKIQTKDRGIKQKIQKLQELLNEEYWIKNGPYAIDYKLTINWYDLDYRPDDISLPPWIDETDNLFIE